MDCNKHDVSTSAYYQHLISRERKITNDFALKVRLRKYFEKSRCSAGSRCLTIRLKADGFVVGRYKVRSLMQQMKLVSKQCKKKPPFCQKAGEQNPS